jgi:hypothetical protein
MGKRVWIHLRSRFLGNGRGEVPRLEIYTLSGKSNFSNSESIFPPHR